MGITKKANYSIICDKCNKTYENLYANSSVLLNQPFYNQVFKYGDTQITRRDLEMFPCPFCTEKVSDEQMQSIVEEIDRELKKYQFDKNEEEEELQSQREDAYYFEMDIAAAKSNIPYYEDIKQDRI